MKKQILITQIVLLGIIPFLIIVFDYFEGSSIYNQLFDFGPIQKALSFRFLALDQANATGSQDIAKRILNRELESNDFYPVWNLIKKHTLVKLPDKEPYLISAFAVKNAEYITLPSGKFFLIPDSMPIGVGYCHESDLARGTCKASEIVVIGSVGDLKDWFNNEKDAIRKKVNLTTAVISIGLGLFITYRDRIRN